jgi:hypothetical protein
MDKTDSWLQMGLPRCMSDIMMASIIFYIVIIVVSWRSFLGLG